MKMTIESTARLITLDGVQMRLWEGETNTGIKVIAIVERVAVKKDQDRSQFERELTETVPPSADVAAWPMRLIS